MNKKRNRTAELESWVEALFEKKVLLPLSILWRCQLKTKKKKKEDGAPTKLRFRKSIEFFACCTFFLVTNK